MATKPNLAQPECSGDRLSICYKYHPDASFKKCARHGRLGKGPGAYPEHAGGTPAQSECWGSQEMSSRKSVAKNGKQTDVAQ